eukprot:jgi/Ulvmu1/4654/UM002_0385.1
MLVGNRVLNKIVMVPLADHVLFLALFQTILYVLVYGGILVIRHMTKKLTRGMLQLARSVTSLFLLIGLCEALQLVLFYTATSKLPGSVLPVLSQAGIVWNFLLSALILGKAFTRGQLGGAVLVGCGAAMVASGGSSGGTSVNIFFAGIYIVATLFPAISGTLKERIFIAARKGLGGQNLDVFVVNTCSSLAQALILLFLLPVILAQRGIAIADMPSYVNSGLSAFCGVGEDGFVRFLPSIGAFWNIAFNIVVLSALQRVGVANVVVAMTAAVPVAVYMFTLPLPVIGSTPLPGRLFIPGTLLLMMGQLAYNWKSIKIALFGPTHGSPRAT